LRELLWIERVRISGSAQRGEHVEHAARDAVLGHEPLDARRRQPVGVREAQEQPERPEREPRPLAPPLRHHGCHRIRSRARHRRGKSVVSLRRPVAHTLAGFCFATRNSHVRLSTATPDSSLANYLENTHSLCKAPSFGLVVQEGSSPVKPTQTFAIPSFTIPSLALLATMSAVACAGPAVGQQLTKVKMARLAFPSMSSMLIDVLKARGIDKKHGIDLETVSQNAV